ncbi:MAG TPA: sigma-70 family RNA polymerase sigma factor, partial [Verrucomicrobiae bacterium]
MLNETESAPASSARLEVEENAPRSDSELLTAYCEDGCEAAFKILLERHVGLVYSAGLRQVRDAQLAEDVTQAVFGVLARKARSLRSRTILSGWLFRTTRFIAARAVRNEQRRRAREQEAALMETLHLEAETENPWIEISPCLDAALADLKETDRNAILLRFFEKRDYKQLGRALGLSDDAAQKRVARALEKLRDFLTRHGIALSVAALAGALTENAVQAAPSGLVASTFIGVTTGSATVAGTSLIQSTLKAFLYARLCATGAVAGVLLATIGAATWLRHNQERALGSIVLGRFVASSGLNVVHEMGDGRTRPVLFDGKEAHELFRHPTNPGSS